MTLLTTTRFYISVTVAVLYRASGAVAVTDTPATPILTATSSSIQIGDQVNLTCTTTTPNITTFSYTKDGVVVPGEAGPTLVIAVFAPSNTGEYACKAMSEAESLDSAPLHVAPQESATLERASAVALTATPTSFVTLLTSTLTLKCSLEASSSQGGETPGDTEQNHVTAIHIFKMDTNGTERTIASVTAFSAPQAMPGQHNLQVTGTTNDPSSIELTWSYPTAEQEGNYSCVVTGINIVNGIGQTVSRDASTFVNNTEATIESILSHMIVQDQKINQLNASMNVHTETGVVYCGDLGKNGANPKCKNMRVVFPKPYSARPKVAVSLKTHEVHKEYSAHVNIHPYSVRAHGFILMCCVENAQEFVGGLAVTWISFPPN